MLTADLNAKASPGTSEREYGSATGIVSAKRWCSVGHRLGRATRGPFATQPSSGTLVQGASSAPESTTEASTAGFVSRDTSDVDRACAQREAQCTTTQLCTAAQLFMPAVLLGALGLLLVPIMSPVFMALCLPPDRHKHLAFNPFIGLRQTVAETDGRLPVEKLLNSCVVAVAAIDSSRSIELVKTF